MDMLGGSPHVRLLPDEDSLHLFGPCSKPVLIVHCSNPRFALLFINFAGLNGGGQKGILFPDFEAAGVADFKFLLFGAASTARNFKSKATRDWYAC
jgi:hypothetical protein